ncbi:MAG: citramalate synthase [Anaerofustis stercorihominis]|nr:citramalate synthase [Anaerofustis stercorihominis]
MRSVEILDTTLRDGAQAEGISFSVEDKLAIIKILDEAGIHIIECGNPYSNPKDRELFEKLRSVKTNSLVAAFGSTRKKDSDVKSDMTLRSLIGSGACVASVVGKSSLFQVEHVLGTTGDENLKMISESISELKNAGMNVYFDCEHFFDGYKNNKDYSMRSLQAASDAGADCLVLCDTNGAALCDEVTQIVSEVVKTFPDTKIGVHFHNDLGLATANTLAAVTAGAVHIQGTLLGFGERCGNASLAEIIPTLTYKMGYECIPESSLRKLYEYARSVANVCEYEINKSTPYIGERAFSHKGGMHIDGMLKDSSAFEHISPEMVGNQRNFLLSEVSGKGAILNKAGEYISFSGKNDEKAIKVLEAIKQKELEGYQYENAEASFELLVKNLFGMVKEYFTVELYRVMGEKSVGATKNIASAMVKIEVGGNTEFTAAEGNGPVNALDGALRRALEVFFPSLKELRLIDYRVRVVNPEEATGTKVRVTITSQSDSLPQFSTIGVSTDVIDASFNALYDSYIYFLSKTE